MNLLDNPQSFRHGKPTIPYSRQLISETDNQAVWDSLASEWISGDGPIAERFEKELASVAGFADAVVVNNGTAALHLAIRAIWRRQQEVTLPFLTFVATANMLLQELHTPSFVDVHPRKLITNATDITVDFAGWPSIGGKLIDASHSLRPNMNKHRALAVTTSFHAVKNSVVTGEGGAILTDDKELAKALRLWRSHGLDENKEMIAFGWNYRLPDYSCALGLSQLGLLESAIQRRRQIAQYYLAEFEENPYLEVPAWNDEHTFHLFVLRLNGIDREAFRHELNANGIGTQVHYKPLHMQPFYKEKYNLPDDTFPYALDAYRRMVSIPIWNGMTDDMIDDVVRTVNWTIEKLAR